MEQMTQEPNLASHRNAMAVKMLKTLGFSQMNINRALPKLTGLTHPDVAKLIGVSRPQVSQTMYLERNNAKLQDLISREYNVPVGDLFPERQ